MKKIIIVLSLLFLLSSCNNSEEAKNVSKNKQEQKIEKLQIITSIIPLASIANYIGWEYVEANALVPSWVSPHSFDLKANQMVDIEKSDLIVYLDLEHVDWFINKAIEKKNNVIAVKKGINLIESSEQHNDEHFEEEHSEEHENESFAHICEENGWIFIEEFNECEWLSEETCNEAGGEFNECASACRNNPEAEICTMQCVLVCSAHKENNHEEHKNEEESHSLDPHIWGNTENAYIIGKTIVDAFVKIRPDKKEYFEENLESFKNELDVIKRDFEEKRKSKKQIDFIVFHDAYNYLFQELNIDQTKKHIFRSNMLNDPNSNEMKQLIDEIKNKWIKIAFKEPQLDASSLKKMAEEYGLEIYVLNPLGENVSKNGYIKNYKNNLESLEKIYE